MEHEGVVADVEDEEEANYNKATYNYGSWEELKPPQEPGTELVPPQEPEKTIIYLPELGSSDTDEQSEDEETLEEVTQVWGQFKIND